MRLVVLFCALFALLASSSVANAATVARMRGGRRAQTGDSGSQDGLAGSEQLLNQVANAASEIGNAFLNGKFASGGTKDGAYTGDATVDRVISKVGGKIGTAADFFLRRFAGKMLPKDPNGSTSSNQRRVAALQAGQTNGRISSAVQGANAFKGLM